MNLRIIKLAAIIIILGVTHYLAILIGTYGALARSAYVNSIAIQQEDKCWSEKDIDCFRAHWLLRAGIAANSAKSSLDRYVPSGVSSELEQYLEWHKSVKP